MRSLLVLGLLALTPALAFAGAHSRVDTTVTRNADKTVAFQFKIVPDTNNVINMDGPWSLEVQPSADISLAKPKLVKSDFQEAMPGFKFASAGPAKGPGELKYKLVAFVCTKDHQECFRDVHNGTLKY